MQGGAYIVGKNVAQFITKKSWEELFDSGWEDFNTGMHSYDMSMRRVQSERVMNAVQNNTVCTSVRSATFFAYTKGLFTRESVKTQRVNLKKNIE